MTFPFRLRNERVALPVASARLVRPLGDQVCRPNCLPVLAPQVELLETTQISQRQTAVTIQTATATIPPPPLPVVGSATTMSPNRAIAAMELPAAEEMEETIFNLLGSNQITTGTQMPRMDVVDTSMPMDSNHSNIIQPETQELQVL